LNEHHKDDFVRKSRLESYRSRAVYKLAEIDQRDHLIKPAMSVVELGAAPGGWTQYVAEKLSPQGSLVAVDILAMDSVPGATILQGDFIENETLDQIRATLDGQLAGLVNELLAPGGDFLVKTFQGVGFEAFIRDVRSTFEVVKSRKPEASRPRSREVYILAKSRK